MALPVRIPRSLSEVSGFGVAEARSFNLVRLYRKVSQSDVCSAGMLPKNGHTHAFRFGQHEHLVICLSTILVHDRRWPHGGFVTYSVIRLLNCVVHCFLHRRLHRPKTCLDCQCGTIIQPRSSFLGCPRQCTLLLIYWSCLPFPYFQ